MTAVVEPSVSSSSTWIYLMKAIFRCYSLISYVGGSLISIFIVFKIRLLSKLLYYQIFLIDQFLAPFTEDKVEREWRNVCIKDFMLLLLSQLFQELLQSTGIRQNARFSYGLVQHAPYP